MKFYENMWFMWRNNKLNKAGRIILTTIVGLFFIIFSMGCSSNSSVSVNNQLKVHFINVGQADSILIQQGSSSMLIDAGNNGDSETVKNYISNQGITKLDYVIGTHPHEDHLGGLDYVIKFGNTSLTKGSVTCEKKKCHVQVARLKYYLDKNKVK